MSLPLTLSDLFAAIKTRWLAQGLDQVVTGGIFAFQPLERTPRPYVVLTEARHTPMIFSNKNRYDDLVFSLELIDADIDSAAPRLKAILNGLGENSLNGAAGSGIILKLLPGEATYDNQVTYLRIVQEFTARATQARVY